MRKGILSNYFVDMYELTCNVLLASREFGRL
jgi:hypothetical protein